MRHNIEKAMHNLQHGEVEALSEIYAEFSRGVFAFVLPIVRDYSLAEDVMQDTFVTVFEKISQYKLNTSPQNWILTIAKNKALGKCNAARRTIATDFSDPIEERRCYVIESTLDNPLLDLANKVLDDEEMQILTLKVIGEYKHKEIAQMLDLPLGTVTWKYNDALKKIRVAAEKGEAQNEIYQ